MPTPTPAAPASTPVRKVLEHFTLLVLGLTVSLYGIGQIQSWQYLSAFSVPSTGVEHSWETHVFMGALSALNEIPNLVLNPSRSSLPWAMALLLALGAGFTAWKRRKAEDRLGRVVALGLGAFSGLCYLAFMILLGKTWGQKAAFISKHRPQVVTLSLAPEALPHLPTPLVESNARHSLRFVATGTDAIFVYVPELDRAYAVPTRLILAREFAPAP